ncbi:MAG: family 10 glycosylhydrolase [Phycisphaeraceae bacterium]|nr:family 10 glycosylhydrolase [Phycisphaeraceae bacterium]
MKRIILLIVMLSALPVFSDADQDLDAYRQQRQQAAHRARRMIYNNDGNDGLGGRVDPPVTKQKFLDARTSALAGSHVDAIFYCTGVFNAYTHQSNESEQLGYNGLGTDHHKWVVGCNEAGFDTLQSQIEFARDHDMEFFWSMRMNDVHDSSKGRPWLFTRWKDEHRDWLMATKYTSFPYGWDVRPTWVWSAVNYEIPQVRDKVFAILQDVCSRYDIDGVELDFLRFPQFFKTQLMGVPVTQKQCDMMTDLLRRVRAMTEEVGMKRGKPMLIAIRVPDSIGYSKELGLDVATWLQEDLVDMVVGGGLIRLQPWEKSAAEVKKFGVPYYACLVDSCLPYYDMDPEEQLRVWRGEALRAWRGGVDGIYTFNVFRPKNRIFRELGDPALLETLPTTDKFKLPWLAWRHYSKNGIRIKGGDQYFDPVLMENWLEPLPQVIDPVPFGNEYDSLILTREQYKLSLFEDGSLSLVDMVNDPDEKQNLAKLKPQLFESMKQQLAQWLHDYSDDYEEVAKWRDKLVLNP